MKKHTGMIAASLMVMALATGCSDDNLQITKILSEFAKKEGYEPVIAYDGEEALELFPNLARSLLM